MSPKKMKGMLKNMGINIDELEGVTEVIIRMSDKEIVLNNASVAIMDAHGQRSYQISGDASERPLSGAAETEEKEIEIPESDVDLVVAQTGAKEEEAAALVEAKGDLAAAILLLARSEISRALRLIRNHLATYGDAVEIPFAIQFTAPFPLICWSGIIRSRPVQRLKGIKQLGLVEAVPRSQSHRFEHS